MRTKILITLIVLGCSVTSVQATDVTLNVEIPRLQVAEYHRPYIAAWLRQKETGTITNLALWYQIDEKGEGETWLKDLRQWWRRSGRSLTMPVDGFTGATRAPGAHQVDLSSQLKALPQGEYTLYVEASREVGGREMLEVPFSWPVTEALNTEVSGETELGKVSFSLVPIP